MFDISFYKGKRVFITGHTGFKGAWMCQVLLMAGAEITGYALEPPTSPSVFRLSDLEGQINSILGDVRNLEYMKKIFREVQPEIVIHMAAQPLVRESYKNPADTYEINVMGTVNILECVRNTESVQSFLNVTTDKVYRNREWEWGYRENEELNGYDPYSNSKSCSELITESYLNSFFCERNIAVSTARAGNVIGGGDFAVDRIIPDCIRAAIEKRDIIVRNPFSIRPYQHVLEPVMAYLLIAKMQYEDKKYAGNYNIGPDESDCWTTGDLVTLFCKRWNQLMGNSVSWVDQYDGGPHEANFLKLDCSKVKRVFGWKPCWNIETAIEKIIEWTDVYLDHGDISDCMKGQIRGFLQNEKNGSYR